MVSISANLNIVFPAEGDETHVFPFSLSTSLADLNNFLTERKNGLYELFTDGKGTIPLSQSLLSSSGAEKLYNFLPTSMQTLAFWRGNSASDSKDGSADSAATKSSHSLFRLAAATGAVGSAFVDVSNADAKVFLSLSKAGPKWRAIGPGVSFSAVCRTPGCNAEAQKFYHPAGFGLFSSLSVKARCPECREETESQNMGFYCCVYRIRALKKDDLNETRIGWTETTGKMLETWDADRAGVADWAFMEVEVRDLKDCRDVPGAKAGMPRRAPVAAECGLCFQELGRGTADADIRMLSCCHSFHRRCVALWSDRAVAHGNTPECPICREKIE